MSTPAPMHVQSISAAAPRPMLYQAPEVLQAMAATREHAAAVLEHAMAYLMVGSFKRLRSDKHANRQAVQILCDARDVLDYTSF